MIIEEEGYNALIEYLIENLPIFINKKADDDDIESIENVITDLVATNIMSVFLQNPDLSANVRFQLTQDADNVLNDLHQVLEGVWTVVASNEQILFLEEYISLMKNLFDSALALTLMDPE